MSGKSVRQCNLACTIGRVLVLFARAMQDELLVKYLARAFVTGPPVETHARAFAELADAIGEPMLQPRPLVQLAPNADPAPRLALGSANEEWLLLISGVSIDVQYSPRVGTKGIAADEYAAKATRWITGGVQHLGRRPHRLAMVVETLLQELPSGRLDDVASILFNRPPSLAGSEVFEWDYRVAVRIERPFGTTRETTNTLATMKRAEIGLPTYKHDRLFLQTDINTNPKMTEPRFEAFDIAAFFAASPDWHRDLKGSLLGFVGLP